MGAQSCFLLSLGNQSKQIGDEGNLASDIPFFHSIHLAFPNHRHTFISLQGFPCSFKGRESQPWLDQPFDAPSGLVRSDC